MPNSKAKRGTEDLSDDVGSSKRSRLSSYSEEDKEFISSEVISKLKDVVKGNRISAIEQWVKAHPVTVEQSNLLCNAFSNESCWSGINPTRLVKELARLDILDPFAMYKIACIECVKSEIRQLFNKMLESFKLDLCRKGTSKENQELAANDKLARVELLRFVEKDDHVFSFWIDEESGDLKENIEPEDGFNKAVDFK